MRTVNGGRRTAGNALSMLAAVGAFALWLAGTNQAFAIPSPELVVGSFVSLSQLFALASAILGGGAAYATMRVRRRGGSAEMSRGLLYTAGGLFAVLVVSIGVNIYQYVTDSNARQARLEATLTKAMPKGAGGKSLDASLKEVSYDEQLRNPRGISTEDMEKVLEAKARGELPNTFLLDIRESAETEMGTMPGAKIVRFPDVKSSNIDFKGKTALLYCHNGNRGYETCQALAAMGIDCRYLIGGLEKWLVEKRPLTGLHARTLDDLRAVPKHRNQSVLLDTPQVRELIQNEDAVFVDVRYPGEFANDRLPGAINLPIRPTPTEELKTKIAQLPHKPIIVPCYDRRSCFFGEVLGLELDRAGFDYRGRYTLPWEYTVPSEPRPYIKEWLAEAHKSWFQKGAEVLASVLSHVADHIGLILTIILLACVSRLLVLPFAVKAERDQIRARDAASEMDDIKLRFKDDPAARARATRAFYKRHNITPIRNLVALLFLPIMALALVAVQLISAQGGPLGWIPDVAGHDPYLILPLAFGVLITGYIDLAFATSWKKRIAIWAIALPALTATGAFLSAAADVYLTTSAVLLIVQRLWVTGFFTALIERWRRAGTPTGVVVLDDVAHLDGCGNKSYRLGRMRAAGLPVPEGLVLTPAFLTHFAKASPAARQSDLDWIWQRLGKVKLAVRSSAAGEDGANNSFAGVFDSLLNIERDGLEAAIGQVESSFATERASSYQLTSGAGNVLVQRMVDAEYSGVLFTRDPSASGLSMIEMVSGTAQDLVSGTTRPRSFRFGRVTKQQFSPDLALIDLQPLLALGDKAEELFGRPQDIEWTFRDGGFFIVQSRDITRSVAGDAAMVVKQNDIGRVIERAKGAKPEEIVFGKNELSEMLPRPTPLSLSLMEALWAPGGSVELAARELGLRYAADEQSAYLVTILGRLYVDKRVERACGLAIGPLAARKLLRTADRIESDFREHFLPRFLDECRLASVADFEKLATADLVAEIRRLHDRFVHDTHVSVDVINISAAFYLDRARKVLEADGVDPSAILGHIPETYEHHALAEATAAAAKSRRWLLLKNFGHRAVLDYELAEPRYAEDINTLNRMIAGRAPVDREADQDNAPALNKAQSKLVDVARRFQTLKEDAKHHSLGELAILRRAVLVLDRRFGFDGRAFHLRFDELLSLNGINAAQLRELAQAREAEALAIKKLPSLGTSLTAHDLEAASAGDQHQSYGQGDGIRGTHVAGSKVIEGRARVVSEEDAELGNPIEDFQDGDIVVATMVNPAWLPYFSRAGGFVSEVGGWLSHPAILAREYDVTMIVGTNGIDKIADGCRLRLHTDGRVEVVDEAAARAAA
ncbi:PEP/pyruvate-binding domain-containing protein [Rhodoplanes sp. Z2-YC6860]|uniref:PEP/pyruvate-binding domain-containing protein n=1 Tax=Rhodoplanes sp. Z2-YC6860 TaxID=674703 RepID=UPI00078B7608|nr:PEP/pyruvate-binding domain-containing protein [Rhodoplanes sp. Z2-YC6860]AMN43849.1 Pyruvate phosphate dikinase PEP/pyruvate-binding protein [Rhodoplanes sp. Z2-YC6860]